jgi:hypothetical protein
LQVWVQKIHGVEFEDLKMRKFEYVSTAKVRGENEKCGAGFYAGKEAAIMPYKGGGIDAAWALIPSFYSRKFSGSVTCGQALSEFKNSRQFIN